MTTQQDDTTPPAPPSLQVLITAGAEDPHKARQGLEVALAAAAMGAKVSVFLTLRGAFWAERRLHQSCVVPGCESIPALIQELVEMDVAIECCSSCALQFTKTCDANGPEMLAGIVVSGLAAMVARTLNGTPSLTF